MKREGVAKCFPCVIPKWFETEMYNGGPGVLLFPSVQIWVDLNFPSDLICYAPQIWYAQSSCPMCLYPWFLPFFSFFHFCQICQIGQICQISDIFNVNNIIIATSATSLVPQPLSACSSPFMFPSVRTAWPLRQNSPKWQNHYRALWRLGTLPLPLPCSKLICMHRHT